MKVTALVLMLVQNASFVLVMRYSRKQQAVAEAARYNVGVVVTLQEAFKLLICMSILGATDPQAMLSPLMRPRQLLNIAVPAVCFTLQNNILYVALSNLDPLLFQITYQVKTLLTALFSVWLLGRTLTRLQWISQLLLMAGIILVQLAEQHQPAVPPIPTDGGRELRELHDDVLAAAPPQALAAAAAAPEAAPRSLIMGLLAVAVAAVSSAYASVYFERLLKSPLPPMVAERDGADGKGCQVAPSVPPSAPTPSKPPPTTSLWERNVELCAWTVPLNLTLALMQVTKCRNAPKRRAASPPPCTTRPCRAHTALASTPPVGRGERGDARVDKVSTTWVRAKHMGGDRGEWLWRAPGCCRRQGGHGHGHGHVKGCVGMDTGMRSHPTDMEALPCALPSMPTTSGRGSRPPARSYSLGPSLR